MDGYVVATTSFYIKSLMLTNIIGLTNKHLNQLK